MTQAKELRGSWKLISFYLETQGSEKRQYQFGANPTGRLMLLPNGRMTGIVTAEDRTAGNGDAAQATLFRSLIAYTGIYRIEGNKFITKVDSSWNEAWNGTDQERYFDLRADELDIVTAWTQHPTVATPMLVRGVLSWQREV